MNKIWKKSIKSLLSISPISILMAPFCSLSSCSEGVETINVDIPQKWIVTNSYLCSTDILFSTNNVNAVGVTIINSSSDKISLQQTSFIVKNGVAHIIFKIDSSITESATFTFDLDVKYKDKTGREQLLHFTQFNVIKTAEQPSYDDRVECETPTQEVHNEHIAYFRFAFYEEPQSNVKVELLDDIKKQLYLIDTEFTAEKHPDPSYNVWYVNVPVHLQMKNFKCDFFPFKLNLSFKNSLGLNQTNKFENCFHLVWDETETVPYDYYDVDDNGVLHGIKNTVSPVLSGYFRTLDIPDGVKVIDSNAFADNDWWKNIKKIIIPQTVVDIHEGAFYGCDNLFEMDLSAYEAKLPSWVNNDTQIIEKNNLTLPIGYIWYGGMDDNDSNLLAKLKNKGFTDDWVSVCLSKCTPADFFSYENISKTTINGISPDYEDYIWYYSVIRIPEQVNKITSGALGALGDIPYFIDGRVDQPRTRRLILNRGLRETGNYIFNQKGFSGSIYIPCTTVTKFGEGIFENCINFSPTSPYHYMDKLLVEPLEFIFDGCDNIETLPKSFARQTQKNPSIEYKNNPIIYLPHNLKTISEHSFWLQGFEGTLSLPNTIEKIEAQAFYPDKLNGDLIIPNSCTSIGAGAFSFHNFKNLTIPNSVVTIDPQAFGAQQSTEETPNFSLCSIDISSYNDIPEWLKIEEGSSSKNIFLNGCSGSGIIYLNATLYNNEQLRNTIFNNFKTNGVPSSWTIAIK